MDKDIIKRANEAIARGLAKAKDADADRINQQSRIESTKLQNAEQIELDFKKDANVLTFPHISAHEREDDQPRYGSK